MKCFAIGIILYIHSVHGIYTSSSESDEESPGISGHVSSTTPTSSLTSTEPLDLTVKMPSQPRARIGIIDDIKDIKKIKKEISDICKLLDFKLDKYCVDRLKTIDSIKSDLKSKCEKDLYLHYHDFIKFINFGHNNFFKRITLLSVFEYPHSFFRNLLDVLRKYNENNYLLANCVQKEKISIQVNNLIDEIFKMAQEKNIDLNLLATELVQGMKIRKRMPAMLFNISVRRDPKEIFEIIKKNIRTFQYRMTHFILYSLNRLLESPYMKKEKIQHESIYYSIEFNQQSLTQVGSNQNFKKFALFILVDALFEYAEDYNHLLYINEEIMQYIKSDESKLVSKVDLKKVVNLLKDKLIMHYILTSPDFSYVPISLSIIHFALTKFINRIKSPSFNRWIYEYKTFHRNTHIFNKIRSSSAYNFSRILTGLVEQKNYDINKLNQEMLIDLERIANDRSNMHATAVKRFLKSLNGNDIIDIIASNGFSEIVSIFILNSINNRIINISNNPSYKVGTEIPTSLLGGGEAMDRAESYPEERGVSLKSEYFSREELGGYPEEQELKSSHPILSQILSSGNSSLWEPRFPTPSSIGGGLLGLNTGSSDRAEAEAYPEEQTILTHDSGLTDHDQGRSRRGVGVPPTGDPEDQPAVKDEGEGRGNVSIGEIPGTSGTSQQTRTQTISWNYMDIEYDSDESIKILPDIPNPEDFNTPSHSPQNIGPQDTNIPKHLLPSAQEGVGNLGSRILNTIDTSFVYQLEAGILPKANYNPRSSLAAAFSAAIIFGQATGEYDRIAKECGLHDQIFNMIETMEFTVPLEGEICEPAVMSLTEADRTVLELIYANDYTDIVRDDKIVLANKLKFAHLLYPSPTEVTGTLLDVLKHKKLVVAGYFPVLVTNSISIIYWQKLLDFSVKIISAYYFRDINAIEIVRVHDLNPAERVMNDKNVHTTEMYFDVAFEERKLTSTYIPVCEMEYYAIFKKSNGPTFFELFSKIVRTSITTERMVFVESSFLYDNIKSLFPKQTIFVVQNNIDLMECIRTDVGIAGITTAKDLNNFDELGYVVHKLPITLSKGLLFRAEDISE